MRLITGMWRELQLSASASVDVRPDRTKTKTSAEATQQSPRHRSELQDFGVTVTALMPGAAETNFFRRAGMEVGAGEKNDPADVARDGFEALMAGKDKVIAGSCKDAFLGFEAPVLPESAKAKIRRKMAEPRPVR